jgi:hypothetical protein
MLTPLSSSKASMIVFTMIDAGFFATAALSFLLKIS